MDWRDARIGAGVGDGWVPLVDELHRTVTEIDPDLIVDQVKEKFGGLRYYYTSSKSDEQLDSFFPGRGATIESIVGAAEVASYWICEYCGLPGAYPDNDNGFWTKTLCETHHEERRVRNAADRIRLNERIDQIAKQAKIEEKKELEGRQHAD